MTKTEEKVAKAIELREYILNKGMTEGGLSRVLAVILTNIHYGMKDISEGIDSKEFQLLASMTEEENLFKIADMLHSICVKNDEVKH